MGLLTKYRAWRLRRAQARVQKLETKSTISDFSALVLSDGFIPAVILNGDNLEQVYEATTWSYAAMSANAEGIASLPGIVQRRGTGPSEARWVIDLEHPLNDFLAAPFGPDIEPRWTWNQLIETIALQIYLAGNSYLKLVSLRGGSRFAVQLLHPQDVDVISDGIRPVGYRHTPRARGTSSSLSTVAQETGGSEILDPSQVIHIMHASPGSQIKGHAPLRTALRSMEIDRTAQERVGANLINRLGIGLVISFEQPFGVTQEQRTEFEKYLADNFQKASRDGSPLVLGSKAKVEQVPSTIDQLAYFDVRKFSRDEILAIFRTPPPMLGVLENATLQNFAQSRRIWWSVALQPLLQTILWSVQRQAVAPTFGEDIRLWFDLTDSEIGLDILSSKADVASKLVGLGYSTNLANARVELGMPFVPELDVSNARFVVAGREENLNEEVEEVPQDEQAPEPAQEAVNE